VKQVTLVEPEDLDGLRRQLDELRSAVERLSRCVEGLTPSFHPELPPVLTIPQVAEILGVSRAAVYASAKRGNLPGLLHMGRTLRVRTDAFLKELR
jgi:excisionase family DNA binding protein